MLSSNEIGDEGVKYLKDIVESRITVLMLADNKITAAGAGYIREALSVPSCLHCLWLEDNNLGDAGTDIIAEAFMSATCELECLSLSGNGITGKGVKLLSEALCRPERFRCLLLNRNKLGVEGAKNLAAGLRESHLEGLSLNDTELGDVGVKLLCESLRNSSQLKSLWLHGNGITAIGATDIGSIFEDGNALALLSLRRNQIGSEGVIQLAKSIKSQPNSLEGLSLCCNGIERLDELFDALKDLSAFNSIDLSQNPLGDLGAASIAKMLKGNSSLRNLLLENCKIGDKGAEDIGQALAGNESLCQLFMDQNPFSEDGVSALGLGLASNNSLKVMSMRHASCLNNDAHMFTFMRTMEMLYTRVDDVAFFVTLHQIMEERAKESEIADPASIPARKGVEGILKELADKKELKVYY